MVDNVVYAATSANVSRGGHAVFGPLAFISLPGFGLCRMDQYPSG